ncbi:DUF7666 domain-containing protein [Halovulum sp. GXIMD14793]
MTKKAKDKIIAYKGFNSDLTCRGYQFEVGKTYTHEGEVEVCGSGFHACEHPLDVFSYYPPATSRFALVELAGGTDRDHDGDSKVAASKIKISVELQLPELIESAVKQVFDAARWIKGKSATGYRGAASATGPQGAASATGPQGAASATGYRGAASATGYRGAASATGPQGAASATGPQGAASATGYRGAASGSEGCALFLVERNISDEILSVWAGIAGRDGIKPDTFYTLIDGVPKEV